MIWFFYIFVFALPFQNHQLLNAKLSGDFTFLKAYGLVLFIYAVGYALLRGFPRIWHTAQAKFLLLFSIQIVLTLFFSASGALYTSRGLQYTEISFLISALILFFMTLTLVNTHEKLRRMMLFIVATMALAGIYIIRGYLGGDVRPGWPFGDSNYFALYAMTAIPIGLAVANVESRRSVRWGCYTAMGLCAIGLVLSRSRMGFVAIVAFGVFYVVRERRRAQGLFLAVLLLTSALMLPSAINRIVNPTTHDQAATDIRRHLWGAALEMIREYPLFGVGPTRFRVFSSQWSPFIGIAHNTYLEIAAEEGIPALLAYLLMLYSSWRSLRRSDREYTEAGNLYLAGLSRGLQGSLLSFLIISLTISTYFIRFGWFIIILTILLRQRAFLPTPPVETSRAGKTIGRTRLAFRAPPRRL